MLCNMQLRIKRDNTCIINNAEYALQYAIKNKTGQTCIINNAEYALQYAIMNKTGQYMHNQ